MEKERTGLKENDDMVWLERRELRIEIREWGDYTESARHLSLCHLLFSFIIHVD